MLKGYVVRIYPTKEQEHLFYCNIGAKRWTWNHMLDRQEENYANGGKYLSRFDMMNLLPDLKRQEGLEWLQSVDGKMLQRTCTDLDQSFQRFFNKTGGHPKFKSKKRDTLSYPCADNVYFKDGKIHIQKAGMVKYKTDFIFPQGIEFKYSFKNPRIKKIGSKWYITFAYDSGENQAAEKLNNYTIGIDMGIKNLLTGYYDGQTFRFDDINKTEQAKELRRRLVHQQRILSRKIESSKKLNGGKIVYSKNMRKVREKIQRLHKRIHDINQNYIHQTTRKIVDLLPEKIVMEDLNIQGMLKNHHLARSIQDSRWHEFRRQIQYKSEWKGIKFALAPRFFASTKTCSGCGMINHDITLKDRTFICPGCGFTLDRDLNAAINLSKCSEN